MKTTLLVLAGFLLHKAVYEAVNVRAITSYKRCTHSFVKTPESNATPWQFCKKHLDGNTLENILLYQPNIWKKWDIFNEN